ncbi:hypothetical protein WJX75_007407 [Coccomyxa subellipsoidea]|uniref:Uncharacterized protein n=1 Tax=Coccomyxa subellipsoidea TaxID=248742 RepID=A0ABR2YRT6_9CHLO
MERKRVGESQDPIASKRQKMELREDAGWGPTHLGESAMAGETLGITKEEAGIGAAGTVEASQTMPHSCIMGILARTGCWTHSTSYPCLHNSNKWKRGMCRLSMATRACMEMVLACQIQVILGSTWAAGHTAAGVMAGAVVAAACRPSGGARRCWILLCWSVAAKALQP